MTFSDIVYTLQNCSLDKETKLLVIDLISRTEDEDLLNDTMELVQTWYESDLLAKKQLNEALKETEQQYELHIQQAHHIIQRDFRIMGKELEKQQAIADVKDELAYHYQDTP